MKIKFSIMFIIGLVLLTACGEQKLSTTSLLKVVEKIENGSEFSISAYNPEENNKDGAFTILVKEKDVFDSIEKDKEYFATYVKKGNNPWILEKIDKNEK